MLTLGIHDGHTATACLLEDGQIIACISEERLNRIKEWSGFPARSIKKCLEITHKSPSEIDAVGVCSLMPQIGTESYLRPLKYVKWYTHLANLFPRSTLQSPQNIKLIHRLSKIVYSSRKQEIASNLREIGITTPNLFFFEHHLLHAATAFHLNWYKNPRTLVITLDGSGDVICATINIGSNGRLHRIQEVFNYNSICDFYTRITQFLGMKPMSHEYKVMGMAPYVSSNGTDGILETFRTYFRVSDKNPLTFINTSGLYKWQFMDEFKKELVGKRFDWIAAATQALFEEVILEWIKNAIRLTGIGDLALSGGGFMNVKLNYLISKLPQVSSLFIFPSCGDESNPIGAALLSALNMGFSPGNIAPLRMIDWGPSYSEKEIECALEEKLKGAEAQISHRSDINEVVSRKIAEGKIVGRFTGRMEWGARALGNRSIIADPRNQTIIHRINKAIKMRDFWMPFAPAILEENRSDYLDLRPDFRCPFMTIAPATKPRAWEEITAGLHPFDKSSRAQVLDPEHHPSFHDLVSRFKRKTGVGGVLNTSFNLHGDPIVCTPEDALDTFLKSGLDALQLENYLVEKKGSGLTL